MHFIIFVLFSKETLNCQTQSAEEKEGEKEEERMEKRKERRNQEMLNLHFWILL